MCTYAVVVDSNATAIPFSDPQPVNSAQFVLRGFYIDRIITII
jgi:hypothetical protein